MSKTILDHSDPKGDGTRVEKFTELEREAAPHAATKALQRRTRTPDSARVKEYLKIDRETAD